MNNFLNTFAAILIGLYLISYLYKNYYMKKVVSKIDNRTYYVRILPDSDKAADLLANINKKILKLIDSLDKDNDKCLRLIEGYVPENLRETYFNDSHKAYSINKGYELALCLRNEYDNKFIDINTIIFVAIHELSHIMTDAYGHPPEFWDNMRYLLKMGII